MIVRVRVGGRGLDGGGGMGREGLREDKGEGVFGFGFEIYGEWRVECGWNEVMGLASDGV